MPDLKWHRLASVSDVPIGEGIGFEVGGKRVAVFNLGGSFHCVSDICTHEYALLSEGYLDDGCIECPLHGGSFDIRTGKAIMAPAETDLQTYPVECRDGEIFVAIEAAEKKV